MTTTPQQFLTYQHNVQRYFRDYTDKYSGVIIPLSIATSFSSGTYGFIRALCSHDSHKQYAIDPRTTLFQIFKKNWDRRNVRDPHKKMAEVFGVPFTTKGLSTKLEPGDFAADSVIHEVGKKCLDFQLDFRIREEDAKSCGSTRNFLV